MLRLLVTSLLALSTAASPMTIRSNTVDLPFVINLKETGAKLPELDRARASRLMSHDKREDESLTIRRRAASFGVINSALVYTANVSVGNPPTSYLLLIDTGSSNTWVGANKSYTSTKSSKRTGRNFSVSYGSANVTGYEFTDRVALSDSLVIDHQSIGVANYSTGLQGMDGILGLGPVDLTKGTVHGESKVPTVVHNLHSQKKINTEVVGISYNPYSSSNLSSGVLTFGGDDSSKYDAPITYASITKSSPANKYWGFDQSITYGLSGSNILSSSAGILDTGTTLILLATDAYHRYQSATGAAYDNSTGMLKITNDQYQNLQSLYFNVGKAQFELTPNAQIWPRSLNTYMGGSSDNIYLVVSDLGKNSGQGLDFINGYTFLERFYSVYDTTNGRIGLASTGSTSAKTN